MEREGKREEKREGENERHQNVIRNLARWLGSWSFSYIFIVNTFFFCSKNITSNNQEKMFLLNVILHFFLIAFRYLSTCSHTLNQYACKSVFCFPQLTLYRFVGQFSHLMTRWYFVEPEEYSWTFTALHFCHTWTDTGGPYKRQFIFASLLFPSL